MAVQPLYDPEQRAAVLTCTTSGWAFGPVFEGADALEQAEEFIDWFASGEAARVAAERGLHRRLGFSGADPREWDDSALEQLYSSWRQLRKPAEEEVAF